MRAHTARCRQAHTGSKHQNDFTQLPSSSGVTVGTDGVAMTTLHAQLVFVLLKVTRGRGLATPAMTDMDLNEPLAASISLLAGQQLLVDPCWGAEH